MPYIKYENEIPKQYKNGGGDLTGWTYVNQDHADIDKVLYPQKYYLDAFLNEIRSLRNNLLKISDAYKLDDFPINGATIEEINTYRQELRDLPATILTIPENGIDGIIWPINPI